MNQSKNQLQNEKAWCKKHPTSYIGKDQFGHWYDQCVHGHRFNEKCEIVIEKEEHGR